MGSPAGWWGMVAASIIACHLGKQSKLDSNIVGPWWRHDMETLSELLASNAELSCCLIEQAVESTSDFLVIWDAIVVMWHQCNSQNACYGPLCSLWCWLMIGYSMASRSYSGSILCMRPANERRCFNVTSPLIGWAHTQIDHNLIIFIMHYLKALNKTLRWKCHHFDKIFITGCTGSCYFDNFQCSQVYCSYCSKL